MQYFKVIIKLNLSLKSRKKKEKNKKMWELTVDWTLGAGNVEKNRKKGKIKDYIKELTNNNNIFFIRIFLIKNLDKHLV